MNKEQVDKIIEENSFDMVEVIGMMTAIAIVVFIVMTFIYSKLLW